MLIGTENSHFRKYLTTLGVSLVAGSLSLGGLFLKLQADLLVESTKIGTLTPIAQETLMQRQRYLQVATAVLPYALGGLVLAGCTMAIIGLRGWATRQRSIDAREELESDKLKVEIRNLTPDEKSEKLDLEVKEVLDESKSGQLKFVMIPPHPDAMAASVGEAKDDASPSGIRSEIIQIEEQLTRVSAQAFGPSRITSQVVLDGKRRYYPDLIVEPTRKSDGYVFELKYTKSINNVRNRISDGIVSAIRTTTAVRRVRNEKSFKAVLVLTFDDSYYSRVERIMKDDLFDISASFSEMPIVIGVGLGTLERMTGNTLKEILEAK